MKTAIYSMLNRLDWGESIILIVSESAMERNKLKTDWIMIQMNAFGFENYRELNKKMPAGEMLLPKDSLESEHYLIKEDEIEGITFSFDQVKKLMKAPTGSFCI